MKRLVSVLCILAAVFMMMSLAACGEEGEKIDGEYTMIEWKSGETDYTPVLENFDIKLTISDDTATVSLMEDKVEWQVDTKEKVMRSSDGSSVPYTVEDNKLTVEGIENGVYGKMVFEKDS